MIKSVTTNLEKEFVPFSSLSEGETFIYNNSIYKKVQNIVFYPVVYADSQAYIESRSNTLLHNAIKMSDFSFCYLDGYERVKPVDIVLDITVIDKR